jgi:hypothetical protein
MHFGRTPGLEIGGGQLDADEIYIDDPRVFLAKVPDRSQTVWSASFQYYSTDQDVILYQQDPVGYLKTPVDNDCVIT